MERRKMKKKGFTLVELLVVIAIIAMLLAILMPALGKVRQMAMRLICGTNISGIGKAILLYSNDDEYESYPIAGGGAADWDYGSTTTEGEVSWDWSEPATPGGTVNPWGSDPPESTISACLYLLVKYADVSPDQYICPAAPEKKFELLNYNSTATSAQSFDECWDFGERSDLGKGKNRGSGHNSYSYQLPLAVGGETPYPLDVSSNPSMAVVADRNPFWSKANENDVKLYTINSGVLDDDSIPFGNATAHQNDGQNVLYGDWHVKFEKKANCGAEKDNIYTTWGRSKGELSSTANTKAEEMQVGELPKLSTGEENYTQSSDDNYLVNEFN